MLPTAQAVQLCSALARLPCFVPFIRRKKWSRTLLDMLLQEPGVARSELHLCSEHLHKPDTVSGVRQRQMSNCVSNPSHISS